MVTRTIPANNTHSAVFPFVQSLLLEAAALGLIFGGCCSNVYALEAIISFERSSGMLLTFMQFLFVASTSYIAQFDRTRPPLYIAPAKIPLRHWLVNITLFFSINVLNNHAFSYNISVPLHIILRSGGSITTMLAGYLYGKRYSRVQALAVTLLSFGIALAAWSNDEVKTNQKDSIRPTSTVGLGVLFVAQLLSAALGLHTETIYQQHGPQWRENLFYSHLLSLPLFFPFMPSMSRVLSLMATTETLELKMPPFAAGVGMPVQLAYLTTNVMTQYACIRGVNLLAANASALTVTVVLSVRKLVSLIISIWLFGNKLPNGTLVGAVIVFSSGLLYSVGSGSKPRKITRTEELLNEDQDANKLDHARQGESSVPVNKKQD
ncbi:hypothetical protein XA68_11299 [Ophiocordyceps unilateralis]|uniref:Sugar phosphate transporter domain-containing protein n=1 Tax=Ophiocordyceps unilateralis TaxID=268505 RepID=A0A2A9NXC4_OPHUN|nr:hypothetical protein XA68_11299 [Ophiocordyceps unilateralis]